MMQTMWSKALILVFVLVFVACYLVGVKTLRGRLILLAGLLIGLAITLPNFRHDKAFFIEKDVTEFAQHIEYLLDHGDVVTAQKKLTAFNRGFPLVAMDTKERFHFIQDLIRRDCRERNRPLN